MLIKFSPNKYPTNTNIKFPKENIISFGNNKTDSFIKEKPDTFDKEKLTKILNGDFRKIDKDFFDNLTPEEYQFCLDWAKGTEKKFSGMIQFSPNAVLKEDVEGIIKYADFYYSGLQKIAYQTGKSMKQVLLVGIGQSPVATVKLLELTGVKTAHCPISGLTTFNEPIEKYVTEENINKYFAYWENFGFSLDELFSDDLIIFTDHKETGRTFEQFKKIINRIIKIKKPEMEKQGKKVAKIKYLSLNSIYKTSKKEIKEKVWGEDFENSVFHTSYLKTLYSPLFKLPLPKINEIIKRHIQSKDSDRRIRFNKLSILLYDELFHPKAEPPQKRFSHIDKEREFRLSFYTPNEEP